MTNTTTRTIMGLATAVLVAGCHDASTSPSSSGNPQSLDLAPILGQMSVGNVNSIPGASSAMSLPATATPPAVVPSACTYSASTAGFTCPSVTVDGLTFKTSYFLYDASGHSQSHPDAATTASVRTVTDGSGTLTFSAAQPSGPAASGTIGLTDHEDMTLSGLLTATRTLNGTGTGHLDLTVGGGTPLHSLLDRTSTTSNVVMPAQTTGASAWPQSGTITSDVTLTPNASTPALTVPIHSVITFNGTSIVTITTSASVFSTTCKIDLSGKTPPVCS